MYPLLRERNLFVHTLKATFVPRQNCAPTKLCPYKILLLDPRGNTVLTPGVIILLAFIFF